jgi:transposase
MALTDASESETEVLTVEEAASILRISRNAAYALARQWRVTGGQSGLPCLELGRCIRVPRSALREMLNEAVRSRPTSDQP